MKTPGFILTAMGVCSHIATMILLYKAGCLAIDTKYAESIQGARQKAGEGQMLILTGATTASLTVVLLAAAIIIGTRQ